MDAQLQAKLNEVKTKIKANAKDAHFAEALIDELVGLQKQADVEPTELIVPCAEVEQTYQVDDASTLIKTVRGFLYKHGNLSYIWVPFGLNSLYNAMCDLAEVLDKKERTEDDEVTIAVISRMLQWHTVAFFDADTLIDSAAAAVKIINDAVKRIEDERSVAETKDDIELNTLAEAADKALKDIAKTPAPDIDTIDD